MTREEMTTEALSLIEEITEYSPNTGAYLKSIYKAVVILSCEDADTKDQTFEDAERKIAEEQKKAEENAEKVKRLAEILEESATIKCSGG